MAKLKAEAEKQGIDVKVSEYTSLAECKTVLDSAELEKEKWQLKG